jgi:receptor protein-tyrosine kinase
VVVVDVDLRTAPKPRHRIPSADAPAGIADVLAGNAALEDVIRPGASEGVSVISAGVLKESSAQLVTAAPMGEVLHQLRSRFTYVLLACSPVTERSESAVVAALSGSSLLVVESGVTRRAELLHAVDLIEGVGMRPPIVAIDHVRRFEPVREVRSDLGRQASMIDG